MGMTLINYSLYLFIFLFLHFLSHALYPYPPYLGGKGGHVER